MLHRNLTFQAKQCPFHVQNVLIMLANAMCIKEQFHCLQCRMSYGETQEWFGLTTDFLFLTAPIPLLTVTTHNDGSTACSTLIA
jgi:hypothetical protein